MDKQISMVHIKSGIQCLIAFQNDSKITESTDIIKRYTNDPICEICFLYSNRRSFISIQYHFLKNDRFWFLGNRLIRFIRMWQGFLNQMNIARFEFNTYTISILVIFFLQTNHKFPTIEQTSVEVRSSISNFKLILKEFFDFYGNRYQIWNHVISTQIGRWQEQRIQPEQKSFKPAQQQFVSFTTLIY